MARNLQETVIINVVDSNGDILNNLILNEFTINNPYNVNIGSTFLPNTEPMTLDLFFSITQKLVEDAQLREGVNEEALIKVVEEYPPEDISVYGNEVISFKVVERKPGMMDTKGVSRPHRKATYSHQEIRPGLPNKVITVESRPVDHVIELNCWALSNKLANKRAIWLEKLLINSAFAYEVRGAERFFFKERMEDKFETVSGQRLFSRPLRFFLRFREFDAKADSMIKTILVDIGILPNS